MKASPSKFFCLSCSCYNCFEAYIFKRLTFFIFAYPPMANRKTHKSLKFIILFVTAPTESGENKGNVDIMCADAIKKHFDTHQCLLFNFEYLHSSMESTYKNKVSYD